LKRVIRELGGWPVADPTWDPDNTLTLEQLIATLKRNFTLGVIIEEWVGPDDRNSLGHVIQVKMNPEELQELLVCHYCSITGNT